MRLNLPVCLAAYAGGILVSGYLPLQPETHYLCIAAILLSLPGLFFRRCRPCLALLVLFSTAILWTHWHETPPPIEEKWLESKVQWQGTVQHRLKKPGGRWHLDLREVQLCRSETCQEVDGKVRVYGKGELPLVLPGDRVDATSRFREPRNFGTPGEFNYTRYLQSRGISLTTYLRNAEAMQVQSATSPGLIGSIYRWRSRLGDAIDARLPPQQAGLVRALVIGDSAAIESKHRALLGRTGLAHLFAISGLHVGLLAWMLYRLLAAVYHRCPELLRWQPASRVLPIGLLLPLSFYLLLAGAGIATQRALLVASVVAVLGLSARTVSPWRILIAIAFALLLVDPLHWYSAGFQLSFAGAGAIVVCWPRWRNLQDHLPKPVHPVYSLLAVSFAATLATAPLVGLHFHQISWIGPIMNLWAVPLIGFVVIPLGLLAALLFSVWPSIALSLWAVAGVLLEWSLTFVEKNLHWLPQAGQDWFLSDLGYLAAGLLCSTLLFPWRPFGRSLALGGSVVILSLYLYGGRPAPLLRIIALSVGQGDAFLVSTGRDQHWLIDGGGLYSETFDVGQRLLLPALGALGVERLERVILSHRHPDHWKGLVTVLRQKPVEQWVAAAPWTDQPASLAAALADTNIAEYQPPAGWSWLEKTKETEIAFWWSPRLETENDRSLVVYLRRGDKSVLFTGDLEAAGVRALLEDGLPGPISVVKLPHHGSRHSATRSLIQAAQPELVFVSAGKGNRYRLPAKELVSWIDESKIPIHRTDLHGTVELTADAVQWKARSWNRGLFR